MDTIWAKKGEMRDHLHEFQSTHFNDKTNITNLRYESKRCCANLAGLYLEDAAFANQDRNIHDDRTVRREIRNRVTGSCPIYVSGVWWLRLCLQKFVQIRFEKAQLK
jgi:hypothetical protein